MNTGTKNNLQFGRVKIFLSHSNKDAAFAIELRSKLRSVGLECWTYKKDLSFGLSIATEVTKHIEECDVFLLIDSAESRKSRWVQREVDFALTLATRNGDLCPAIVSVKLPGAPNTPFPRRDFRWGLPKKAISLTENRAFFVENPHTDDFIHFFNSLQAKIDFFGTQQLDSSRIPNQWDRCYEMLFPNIDERDDPNNILRWLELNSLPESDWNDMVVTLRFFEQVVGFCYLNYRKSDGWIWGSYMGVLRRWRAFDWARKFLSRTLEHAIETWDNPKGILFEIDPISDDLCRSAIYKLQRGSTLTKKETENARNVKRAIYSRNGAKALVGVDGTPVFHKQPYMYKSADFSGKIERDREVELILMVYPLATTRNAFEIGSYEAVRQAIAFTFDMYKEYYGGVPQFDRYIESVCDEVIAKLPSGVRWGSFVSESANQLFSELVRRRISLAI
jgi:hypothetical protein